MALRRRSSAALAALAFLVGCGDDTSPAVTEGSSSGTTNSAPTTATPFEGATIVIEAFVYLLPEVVHAGEPITVHNADHADHTVTADDGSFSVFVAGDASGTLVVTSPGTHPFYCRVHPDMRGVLRVA